VDHSAPDPVDCVMRLCHEVQGVTEGEGVVEFKVHANLPLLSVADGPEDVGIAEEGEVDSEDELQSLLYIKNTTVDVFVI